MILDIMTTTIFEKNYDRHNLGSMERDVSDIWSIRVNPLVRKMPEELTKEKFKGTLRIKVTYEETRQEGSIEVGDKVKMIGYDSPLMTVERLSGEGSYYYCEWYVNGVLCNGRFLRDAIMIH